MKNKLLAVDDDQVTLEAIQTVLRKQNFEVICATSGKEALALFLENPTLVIISDLNMPEMSGIEFMLNVFESGHKPVFIMLTAETDVKNVVKLFQQGIQDYIIKPFNPAELLIRVNLAFEFAELRIINERIQKEREIRIENQLNWNLYKEDLLKKDSDRIDSGLVKNINNSLFQGSGFGTLGTLVVLIRNSNMSEDGGYIISKEIFGMLLENVQFSNKMIQMVGDINEVINTDLPKNNISINELHRIIEEAAQEVSVYQKVRGNSIVVAENTHTSNTKSLNINTDYFKKVAQELLYNAFKFSETGSKIYILFEILKDCIQISFLNTPDSKSNEQNGIGQEYYNIIFEPFFRISRYIFEGFPTLDSGLGLCWGVQSVKKASP